MLLAQKHGYLSIQKLSIIEKQLQTTTMVPSGIYLHKKRRLFGRLFYDREKLIIG